MPNITPRKNKAGQVISYRIRVARGYDSEGHKNSFHEKTWKPAPGMTEKQIKKEVQKVATLFEEQCKTGIICTQQNLTLEKFIPQYLDTAKETLSPSTYEFYISIINRFILPMLGHHKLQEIKPVHVQAFISQLNNVQSSIPNAKNKISPNTVKRYLCVLQSIFRLAVKLGIISDNPASAVKLTLKKTIKPEIDIFNKQEATEMLSALKDEPLQFQVFIQLAIMTGARRGELVALKFSDFDMIT
ncbi:MAG: tyrosine-type recombinase/integrase family protein, partial [Ruminococcus sp.]|nr:tyrosine-type recombinase/integrase family protein [Ruminococcus sp.]